VTPAGAFIGLGANLGEPREAVEMAMGTSVEPPSLSLAWVPAHGPGFARGSTLAQRKAGQEPITPIVVEAFAWLYAKQPTKLDDRWAALCRVSLACRACVPETHAGGASCHSKNFCPP
jgi:hypothetical protein